MIRRIVIKLIVNNFLFTLCIYVISACANRSCRRRFCLICGKLINYPKSKLVFLPFEPNFKEKWSKEQIAEEKQKLAQEKIDWYVLPYHKSPSVPATLYDVFCGARLTQKLIKKQNINILHARVHVPALMGAIAKMCSRNKVKLIFDIRGFMPEEYIDAGTWKADGILYRTLKKIESWLMKEADAFVVLTEAAREILFPESRATGFDKSGRPVEVIPCCIDADSGIVVKDLEHLENVILDLAKELKENGFISCESINVDKYSRTNQVERLAEIVKKAKLDKVM